MCFAVLSVFEVEFVCFENPPVQRVECSFVVVRSCVRAECSGVVGVFRQ